MSRSTQYVGLTRRATDFLQGHHPKDNLTLLEDKYNDRDIHFEKRYATGMMEDEMIPLGTWKRDLNGRAVWLREVVQCTPWSGGPMIFTCLEIDYGNGEHWDSPGDEKYDRTSAVICFQWIDDPTISEESFEADRETGRMWV